MAGGFGRSELTFSLVLTAAMLTQTWAQWKGIFKKGVIIRVSDGYLPGFARYKT
jgi:ABC-type antimicrobial peptide transport system permease subunit